MIKFTKKGKVKMDRKDYDSLVEERNTYRLEAEKANAALRAQRVEDYKDLYDQLDLCDQVGGDLEILCASLGDEVWITESFTWEKNLDEYRPVEAFVRRGDTWTRYYEGGPSEDIDVPHEEVTFGQTKRIYHNDWPSDHSQTHDRIRAELAENPTQPDTACEVCNLKEGD